MDTAEGAPTPGTEGADPLIGRVLDGRYRILSMIAKGGMGRIYRAEQQPLGRHVALKVLSTPPHVDLESLSAFRQRFFREASICSKLTHPNTVRIYDYGKSEDGIFFIAMEFLEGRTLRQILAKEAPMAPWRAIDLLRQVCASLAEAHSMGLIHRDLKPSNLIITTHADGTEFVNVVDFGLVKDLEGGFGDSEETQAGMIVGSPMYMSPEQILQEGLTERTDIYSLGVILYGMLTGRRPFRQESSVAIMNCHLNVPPPPFAESNPDVEVPANLEWITMTCLEKEPEDRFANVQELARALGAVDRELRGLVAPFQLQLSEGRVVLPVELEEAMTRRSSTSGSISTSTMTLHKKTQQAEVVDATDGSGGKVGLALVIVIGILLGALGVVWWSQRGDEPVAENPQLIDVTEDPAPATGAAEAPPPEPAPPEEAPPAEAPPAAAGAVTADGAAPPEPPPLVKPPPSPEDFKPVKVSPPDEVAAPEEPPPEEPPPEAPPAEGPKDDWSTPQSDIRDPWGD
ncbi:MAG: serine/threonine protein kinase [Alphaproteobacteria bacterium]|nr:serine/threonine protein kinase [Alphaproteobacteria bacterium]